MQKMLMGAVVGCGIILNVAAADEAVGVAGGEILVPPVKRNVPGADPALAVAVAQEEARVAIVVARAEERRVGDLHQLQGGLGKYRIRDAVP